MSSFPVLPRRRLNVLLAAVVATTAYSQPLGASAAQPEQAPPPAASPAGSVHRMVIQEGANRRVAYIAGGDLSPADRRAVSDLERAENELTYLHNLQRLKQQYVESEMSLEPQRRIVQRQLYGKRIHYGSANMNYVNYGGTGYGAYGGYGNPGLGGYNVSYPYWHAGYGGFGGYGYGNSAITNIGANSYSEDYSLQYGVGDEGVMKRTLMQSVARDAVPESIAAAVRSYDAAAARAADSPILSRDLGLKKTSAAPSREPSFTKGSKATVWVGNEKYVGTVKEDRPGWLVLQTDKAEVTVRKSEITRTETPSKP